MAVHDKKPWGFAPAEQQRQAQRRVPRRAAAPWGGLSAVPTVGAVMASMR